MDTTPDAVATAEFETRRIHFLSGGPGPLELFYGNPDAASPRYDLALLADRLNASSRSLATLGSAGDRSSRWDDTGLPTLATQILFWGVLVVVVGALFAVIRRLLPAPTDPR